ncbi:MAG TPA: tetratricopeptide repeat protein [Holophagaceae bacterium]|jgi:tol-pal system protein YbgF|nr:tetratricopeptide repeat protein [Holophagaceae bacterium]
MKSRILAFPLALVALMSTGCASDDQMARVEQEVGDLKVEVFKLRQQAEEQNRKADAETQAASQFRDEDRRFRADLSENLRQIQNNTRTLGNRVSTMSRQEPAASATATPQSPAGDDEKAYNAAMLDYNRGNYALASDGFGLLVKTYPQSARKADALFFMGLCQYNQRAYDKAQAVFEQIAREMPTSNQFLPAKLKRAQCMERLGLKAAAVKALQELVNGFPGTAEARTAKQELDDLGF